MTRRDRGNRRSRGAVLGLLLAAGLSGQPALAAGGCEGRFPQLRGLLKRAPETSPVLEAAVLKTAAGLGRELAIERALWEDEVTRQRRHLEGSSKNGSAALLRLEDLDERIRRDFEALEAALAAGEALPAAAAKGLAACPVGKGLPSVQPISSRLAPVRGTPLERRRPRRAAEPPEGYAEPPSEELRQAVHQAAPDTVGPQKLLLPRPDPIAAKADELNGDPVAIYGFVLDQIRPAHYFGAAKGPAAVLRSGEGSDADQAALLAALMRAAGFPARVAWGVQEVPAEALRLHFGARNLPASSAP